MKYLKDYLPLYIGCDIYIPPREKGAKADIMKLSLDKFKYDLSNVKLILRQMYDMTEEEYREVEQWKIYQGDTIESFALIAAECTNWLRKTGIDCDGLIQSGLALDKIKDDLIC